MKIVDIQIVPFRLKVDRFQNGVPHPGQDLVQTLTKILTDDGAVGYYFGGQGHGDRDGLVASNREYIENRIKPILVGENPFDRQKFWQWLYASKTPENLMSVIDLALWDLAGRVAGLPVHQLLGSCRERVLAYGSTYPNLGPPELYAEHALACKKQG